MSKETLETFVGQHVSVELHGSFFAVIGVLHHVRGKRFNVGTGWYDIDSISSIKKAN